jgi:hypothetical protein
MKWEWSDAWLLLSIKLASGGKGADLKGIIMIGDRINHAIFTVKEIKSGLEKLISIDYVKIKNNRFFLTGKFEKDFKKIGYHPNKLLDAADRIEDLLLTKKLIKEKIKTIGTNIINATILNNAYLEYMR